MRSIVFHIGLHKTGTTAFQSALASGRQPLAEAGFIYPDRGDIHHSRDLYTMFGQDAERYLPNALRGLKGDVLEDYRDGCFDAWRAILDSAGEDDCLLVSGEDLSRFREREWQLLFDFFALYTDDFLVVAVVREPLAWAASSLQQGIKGGLTFGEADKAATLPMVARKLRPVVDVVGAGRVRILRFEDLRQAEGGLAQGLAEACGIPKDLAGDLEPDQRNSALTDEAVALLDAVNRTLPVRDHASDGEVRQLADFRAFEGLPGRPFRLTAAEEEVALAGWEEDRLFLSETFGLDVPAGEGAGRADRQQPPFSGEMLSAIGERIIAGWLDERRVQALSRKVDALKIGRRRQRYALAILGAAAALSVFLNIIQLVS